MSPGLAARTALVCVLVLMGGISHADRRPVAVVDLSAAPEATKLATDIRGELGPHADLQPVLSQFDETALTEPIADEDVAALAIAARAQHDAEAQREQFLFGNAQGLAKSGMEQLLFVTPSAGTKLYAELALTYSLTLFQDVQNHREREAAGGFALVHKLLPARTLDPVQYMPELVDAFEAARTVTATGTIEIKGTGIAWLDGAELGPAPQTITAAVGLHYVQLTSAERETRGASVVVAAQAKSLADIVDAPASHDLQVHRARTTLARATDAVSRASAIQHLARLVAVEDAILILDDGGKLRVQTWRASAGFSTAKDLGNQKPGDLLDAISPPRPRVERPIPVPVIPIEEPRWYQDRRVQVSTAVGVATAIIIAILWARSNVDSQLPMSQVGFAAPK